jgi:hypothetical protein
MTGPIFIIFPLILSVKIYYIIKNVFACIATSLAQYKTKPALLYMHLYSLLAYL